MSILNDLKFDDKGLIPALVQDEKGTVLMLAFMNKTALLKTLKSKKMCYFSRSRKKLWLKGEDSGHFQYVKKVAVDCDGDCLLFTVRQKGGACHGGYYSCFFRRLRANRWKIVEKRLFDPKKVYQVKDKRKK